MSIEHTFLSHSEAETEAFAAKLAARFPRGKILTLYGDLGAGKTVFARGFARGLGITEPISSPTYTIIQEYPLPDYGWFYHLDLYRINNSESALMFGVDEFLSDPESVVLMEWPERIQDILPANTIKINIRHLTDTERELVVTGEIDGFED